METEKVQKKQYTSHIPTSFPEEATKIVIDGCANAPPFMYKFWQTGAPGPLALEPTCWAGLVPNAL